MYKKKNKKNNKLLTVSIVLLSIILIFISLFLTRQPASIEVFFKDIASFTNKVFMYPFTALNTDKNIDQSESYLIQKNVNESLEKEIKELKDKGNSVREIAKILGISKSKVGRLV